jgi:hypothetical protein
MAKALGAEIMEFYDHHWPEGYYHDDSQIEFHDQNPPPEATDDIWILEPETKYDLDQCGVLISEKDGERLISRWHSIGGREPGMLRFWLFTCPRPVNKRFVTT